MYRYLYQEEEPEVQDAYKCVCLYCTCIHVYVNQEEEPELQDGARPDVSLLERSILTAEPRVTRFRVQGSGFRVQGLRLRFS